MALQVKTAGDSERYRVLNTIVGLINEEVPDASLNSSPDVNFDTRLDRDHLNVDEVDREVIGLALEERYGISFPKGYSPKNVGEVVDYILQNRTKQ